MGTRGARPRGNKNKEFIQDGKKAELQENEAGE